MLLFDIRNKIQINKEEVENRLSDEVELVELIDTEGNEIGVFEEDFPKIYDFINSNVKTVYVKDESALYINEFVLELNNDRQVIVRVL